jgi:protoporphyrinogen oxidase
MKHAAALRIGIVGAGPAGLMAAEALRDKGYTNITVLERSERAGGKCSTVEYEGRSYELGAGIVADSSRVIRDLARKYDVPMETVDFSARVYLDIKTGQPIKKTAEQMAQLMVEVCRYYFLAMRYREIAKPGFKNVDKNLSVPFTVFAKQNKIEHLATEFANYFTGFGYGFMDEVPAAYVLKYYPWDIVFAYLKRSFFKFPGGIQGLWDAIAKSHHVKFGVNVAKITRGEGIIVTTHENAFTFDKLIVAAPLDESLRYLDASEDERSLFRRIRHYDYRTYACLLKDFPKVTGYIPANQFCSRIGEPVFWYQRYTDSNLYTFYCFGDWKMTDEEVVERIRAVVEQQGGSLEKLEMVSRWKFFPHINADYMRDGYFDKLESIQGRQDTYYVGELLNFSTVTHSASYSKDLVERFF